MTQVALPRAMKQEPSRHQHRTMAEVKSLQPMRCPCQEVAPTSARFHASRVNRTRSAASIAGSQRRRSRAADLDCLVLDAGADVNLDCTQPCTDLTASIIGLPSQNTSSYIIADPVCPLPPISGGTVTSIDADDEWSNAINLPFEFTYYENTYNQIVVGGNGQVSFDITKEHI